MRKLTLNKNMNMLLVGSLVVLLVVNGCVVRPEKPKVSIKEPTTNLPNKRGETSSLRALHASDEFDVRFIKKWGSYGSGDV